jgi:hypothetical protein
MSGRKIVQIAVEHHSIDPHTADDSFQYVFALCDDGSVWHHCLDVPGVNGWNRLPDIPQDNEIRGFGAE